MYYFAYGSNMNQSQMKVRCKNFSLRFIKKVYLEGYRFVYDGDSPSRQCAVANVVKDEKCRVWGALYEIDENYLSALDRYEGYPIYYQRKKEEVKDVDGAKYSAWFYFREPKEEGQPSDEYREVVFQGAKECNLPEEYIKKYILGQNS